MTACATPDFDAPPPCDEWAERVVLCGVLTDPAVVVPELAGWPFEKGDLYFSAHQKLYDLALYTFHGGVRGPVLADTFAEMQRRGDYLGLGRGRAIELLLDVWFADVWFAGIGKWADMRRPGLSLEAWAALAAGAKVRHLAARRRAMHEARELLRESLTNQYGSLPWE